MRDFTSALDCESLDKPLTLAVEQLLPSCEMEIRLERGCSEGKKSARADKRAPAVARGRSGVLSAEREKRPRGPPLHPFLHRELGDSLRSRFCIRPLQHTKDPKIKTILEGRGPLPKRDGTKNLAQAMVGRNAKSQPPRHQGTPCHLVFSQPATRCSSVRIAHREASTTHLPLGLPPFLPRKIPKTVPFQLSSKRSPQAMH